MIELRRMTDVSELMPWRKEVIANVFGVDADHALAEANRQYYQRHIAEDSHIAYVAIQNGTEVGCGAICLTDELPSPDNPSGRCAYLMNIYVRQAYRNKGVAHKIVCRLVEDARSRGCGKIYLEATDMAKSIYRSIGFKPMDNLMKYED